MGVEKQRIRLLDRTKVSYWDFGELWYLKNFESRVLRSTSAASARDQTSKYSPSYISNSDARHKPNSNLLFKLTESTEKFSSRKMFAK